MILPRSGEGLPPWRRGVARWLMAAVRLGVASLLIRAPLALLLAAHSWLEGVAVAPLRFALAAVLAGAALAFAWPRSYLAGAPLLLLALGAHEWLWHRAGLPIDARLMWSVAALLSVLTAGEWLTRRLQARLYRTAEG